jgi:hypothetical protein
MREAGRQLLAGDAAAAQGEDTDMAATLALCDGVELLMRGPSLFPPVVPYQEAARLIDGGPSSSSFPAPVPEPASIALFVVPLALMAGILVSAAARRRRPV